MLNLTIKSGAPEGNISMNESTNAVSKNIIGDNCILRDKFPLSQSGKVGDVYDTILIRHPNNATAGFKDPLSKIVNDIPSIEEYIEYINANKIERANIIANDIIFLTKCPTLKYLSISPSDKGIEKFDYSPLYEMPEIKELGCRTVFGENGVFSTSVDYSKIHGLEFLRIGNSDKSFNFEKVQTLKTLVSREYQGNDLYGLFRSPVLDTLEISVSKIKTLNGIQQSNRMQCLYLHYNFSLCDIDALYHTKDSLRSLCIENCVKIKDFSVLGELHNLERLILIGSNRLPNLNFIKALPKLSTFCFSFKVEDGDLSPCLSLPYVYCSKNYKHYNFKDKHFSKDKSKYSRGNDNIEVYRRLV